MKNKDQKIIQYAAVCSGVDISSSNAVPAIEAKIIEPRDQKFLGWFASFISSYRMTLN